MDTHDHSPGPIKRREFLRLLAITGGITAASPWLPACTTAGSPGTLASRAHANTPSPSATSTQPPSPTSTETEAAPPPEPTMQNTATTARRTDSQTRVAFVKTEDRAAGVEKALALLGINPAAGKKVFVKPNFNSADPPPGSTHPEILRALFSSLQEMGASQITLGDRSGMGNTRQVMQSLGVFDLAAEWNVNTIVFDELGAEDWRLFQPTGSHWAQGFALPQPCLDADVLIQTCCLKTHQYGGHFTMSLKNSVGLAAKHIPGNPYNYMEELHNSRHQRTMIAEINTAYTPALILLDGVSAFVSGGPARGKQVAANLVLAGTDRIAIDAIGVAVLRYFGTTPEVMQGTVFEQAQIARAAELGIGVTHPEMIEFVTDDPASAEYAAAIQQILLAG